MAGLFKRKARKREKTPVVTVTVAPAPTEVKAEPARVVWSYGSCHEDPKEVAPGLWCGSREAALDMARRGVEVLVPLAGLDGCIWDTGWRGEILYVPVEDYGALPPDVLAVYVRRVADLLRAGKSVGIFCMGGHGRTGYFAAAVLGRLYPEIDPVEHLRGYYCEKAVESREQLNSLARYLGRAELLKHGPAKEPIGFWPAVKTVKGGESGRLLSKQPGTLSNWEDYEDYDCWWEDGWDDWDDWDGWDDGDDAGGVGDGPRAFDPARDKGTCLTCKHLESTLLWTCAVHGVTVRGGGKKLMTCDAWAPYYWDPRGKESEGSEV